MISKHSHEQSDRGEGVEVVQNEPYEDPEHGKGQFTEKRVYLNRSFFFFIVEYLMFPGKNPLVHRAVDQRSKKQKKDWGVKKNDISHEFNKSEQPTE